MAEVTIRSRFFPEAKRLKQLEEENNRLKKIIGDQAWDIQMLKEIAKGN
jgi:hypothetical protein